MLVHFLHLASSTVRTSLAALTLAWWSLPSARRSSSADMTLWQLWQVGGEGGLHGPDLEQKERERERIMQKKKAAVLFLPPID